MSNKFDGLLSLKEAAEKYNRDDSTLRRAIKNNKLVENVDCKKFGKQWVITVEAMEREYNNKN